MENLPAIETRNWPPGQRHAEKLLIIEAYWLRAPELVPDSGNKQARTSQKSEYHGQMYHFRDKKQANRACFGVMKTRQHRS
ncbi:MAG: hypothetical protein KA511_04520 [Brachymonas sp.]|nr:hypothetical protein [Brachymonas sp.]